MITIKIQRDGNLPKGSVSAFPSRDVHFPYGLFMEYRKEEISFAKDLLREIDFAEYACNNNQFFSTLMLYLHFFKPSHLESVLELSSETPNRGREDKVLVWAYPELALLPGHQSKLMDMFSVLNRYKDVNVVTLSEYMVRKSQVLVMDKKSPFFLSMDEIKLYEIYGSKDENSLEELIEVDFSVPDAFTII